MHKLTAATLLALALLAAPAAAQDPTPVPTATPTATPTTPPVPAPANDAREAAQAVAVPGSVRGMTVGATSEPNEPASCDGTSGPGSVWYAVNSAAVARDLVVELDAAGDLDAVVDVYRRDRSQLTPLGCGTSDRNGRLTIETTQARNVQLLIRVAPLANSVADAFTLRVVAPDAPEPPPGRALPAGGVGGSVDRIANPDDAYGVSLKAGRTYRVRIVSAKRCVTAGLYAPGTKSFAGAEPVKTLNCDDYVLFTPGPGAGGRYSLQVQAPRNRRGALAYRIEVASAGADDTAPGMPLRNGKRTTGTLRGSGTDVVDLYRFAVVRRSTLDLRLRTGTDTPFDLRLVSAGGKRIACACGATGNQGLRLKLKPGRYFAAVRSRSASNGGYVLSRLTRTITKLDVRVKGRSSGARLMPDETVPIDVTVRPGAEGPITLDLERFDPLAGWQFQARVSVDVRNGRGGARLTPLGLGRWRVRVSFAGTRRFAPSGPDLATFSVQEPLADEE